jgi:hypothetical protein
VEEQPFVPAAEKMKDGATPRPNNFLLIEWNVRYVAWLRRPPAPGAPVAMTLAWEVLDTPTRDCFKPHSRLNQGQATARHKLRVDFPAFSAKPATLTRVAAS